MANKEIKQPEKVKLKLWDTKASQDITGWQLEENKNLEAEIMKKLDSLLPYANDNKSLNRYKNWNPKYDNYEDDAIEKKLETMWRNHSADLWDDVEDSALKQQPVKAVLEWGVWPYVAWAADVVHQVWNASANWYKRVYNYIANLINNKKLDEANELVDAIIEMNMANRDLNNKENKNGK